MKIKNKKKSDLLDTILTILIIFSMILITIILAFARHRELIQEDCCKQYNGEIKIVENQFECNFISCYKCFVSGEEIKNFTSCKSSIPWINKSWVKNEIKKEISYFWRWDAYASFDRCIEATERCNLESCPDTKDCCMLHCLGTPTIKGVVLIAVTILSITLISYYFQNKRKNEN